MRGFPGRTTRPRLWADVAAFPAHCSEQALVLFLKRICEVLGAFSSSWLAMKKLDSMPRKINPDDYQLMIDKMDGWAPMAAVFTNPDKNLRSILDRWLECSRVGGMDAMSKAVAAGRGSNRTYRRADVATEEEWEKHWISGEFLSRYGVGDRMIAMFCLGEDAEACVVIDRAPADDAFSAEDKRIFHLAVCGIAGLHKRVFMENGLFASSCPLSKRERELYRYLLTDLSESQIAERMKLSVHTIHSYARGLYKKFGVKGRIGLMALVLNPG